MSKADVLRVFRTISTDNEAAAQVAAGDLSGLLDVELTDREREMVVGTAGELVGAGDVVGFQWVDPAGGGNDDTAGENDPGTGLTFTRTGDIRAEYRYVKQLTTYVGLGKPSF